MERVGEAGKAAVSSRPCPVTGLIFYDAWVGTCLAARMGLRHCALAVRMELRHCLAVRMGLRHCGALPFAGLPCRCDSRHCVDCAMSSSTLTGCKARIGRRHCIDCQLAQLLDMWGGHCGQ